MLQWLKRAPNGSRRLVRPPRITLEVERLERRDCPSNLQITSFTAMAQAGNTVMLSGQVMDSNPASVHLTFSGVASGSITANASGYFSLQTQASALGTIFAQGIDGDQSSSQAQTTLADPGISISLGSIMQGPNRTVTVMGQVNAPSAGGLTVTLGGVVSGSTTTSSTGSFTWTGPASALGTITAAVTDVWGVRASASGTLTDTPPQIVNFQAIESMPNVWTFQGSVNWVCPQGMTVYLSGTPLGGTVAVTVNPNGSFSYTAQLAPTTNTAVYADVTDCWGEAAQTETVYV